MGSISSNGEEYAEMIVHDFQLRVIFIAKLSSGEKGGFKGAGENYGSFSILRGPALPLLWYSLVLVLFDIRLLSQDYVECVLWHHLTQLAHCWLAFVQIYLQDSKGWF
ncbi:hypothetical protein AVEN_166107-1 [Araneus ventricosus]|uniref:Uncharacterized protein n=1 Tax=Araneus ventricosus TaxID=182803 RepID=A0A4Y2FQR2_ARAVE|nr:hypothetical protein AVEN_166107-1 [Araneus ventricosus]